MDTDEAAGVPFDSLLDRFQVCAELSRRALTPGPLFDDLVPLQASSRELQAELARIGAVDLGAGWQGIRPEYLATLLEMVILTATQQGWPLRALPAQELYNALQADGYDPRLIHAPGDKHLRVLKTCAVTACCPTG